MKTTTFIVFFPANRS